MSREIALTVAMPSGGGRSDKIGASLGSIIESAERAGGRGCLQIAVFLNGCTDGTANAVERTKRDNPHVGWKVESSPDRLPFDKSLAAAVRMALEMGGAAVIAAGDDDRWAPGAFAAWQKAFAAGAAFVLGNFTRMDLATGQAVEAGSPVVSSGRGDSHSVYRDEVMFAPHPLGSLHRFPVTTAINIAAIGWEVQALKLALQRVEQYSRFGETDFIQCYLTAAVLGLAAGGGYFIDQPVVAYGVNPQATAWRPDLWGVFNRDYLNWMHQEWGYSLAGINMVQTIQRPYESRKYFSGGRFRGPVGEMFAYLLSKWWYNRYVRPQT